MVLFGVVLKIERDGSGVIRDSKRKEYFFHQNECKNLRLPRVGESVSFIKDPDYSTPVATLVQIEAA